MTTPILAAAYIRTSTLAQADDDRDGPDRQRAAILKFSEANGFQIDDRWFQDAVSGSTDKAHQRVAWFAMRDCLIQQNIKVVFVENIDRLARSLMVQETFIDDFTKLGIAIYDASGTDISVLDGNLERKMIRQILGAVAEYVKAANNLRMHNGRRRRIKDTGWAGGKYAYGEHPEFREVERANLLRIMELDRQQWTLDSIAQMLNDEGRRTRRGSLWTRQSVYLRLTRLNRLSGGSASDEQAGDAAQGSLIEPDPA
jgi:DNA invertase Pin-like site-specific DNA recombinase